MHSEVLVKVSSDGNDGDENGDRDVFHKVQYQTGAP